MILTADDEELLAGLERAGRKDISVFYFGKSEKSDLRILDCIEKGFSGLELRFSYKGQELNMSTKLIGAHNAYIMLQRQFLLC